MRLPAIRLIRVDLIFRHRLIGLAHADEGPLQTPPGGLEARPLRHIQWRDLRNHELFSLFHVNRHHRANNRRHLLPGLRQPRLQALRVINPDLGESLAFVQSKKNHPAVILVGKRREGVIEPLRTPFCRGFDLHVLRFALLTPHLFYQFPDFFFQHDSLLGRLNVTLFLQYCNTFAFFPQQLKTETEKRNTFTPNRNAFLFLRPVLITSDPFLKTVTLFVTLFARVLRPSCVSVHAELPGRLTEGRGCATLRL